MHVTRYKDTDIPDWYMASYSFATKYGTIATASGYGNSFARAIMNCLKDYKIIISL